MSSRILKFEANILILWNEIEKLVKGIDVHDLLTDERDEIARLNKVVSYLSRMLNSIDPDFVPNRVLESAEAPISNIKNSLINYNKTKNFNYIKRINSEYLDTLLKDLMPFIFYSGEAESGLTQALKSYSETITEHSKKYLNTISGYSDKAKEYLNIMEESVEKTEGFNETLSEFSTKLNDFEFTMNKSSEDISVMFEDLAQEGILAEKHNKAIVDFYNNIFSPEIGIKKQIENHLEDSIEKNRQIQSFKQETMSYLDELKIFHNDIFGTPNDKGELDGGLKNELSTRRKELDDFKEKQQKSYHELYTQIENLLPGATSAGLSSAYNQLHEQFNEEVKSYGKWFYGALGILFLVVMVVTVTPYALNKSNNSSSMPVTVQTAENSDENIEVRYINKTDLILNNTNNEISISNRLVSLLDNFIYKFPFILPALWLVLFISKRRKEAQRLAQEYAHKEALAKSYESYKQQIEKLDEEDKNKLLPILMENMLKAIALNPAETLDKNANNETPMEEVIKKKEFWDMIEKLKSFIPSKSDK